MLSDDDTDLTSRIGWNNRFGAILLKALNTCVRMFIGRVFLGLDASVSFASAGEYWCAGAGTCSKFVCLSVFSHLVRDCCRELVI